MGVLWFVQRPSPLRDLIIIVLSSFRFKTFRNENLLWNFSVIFTNSSFWMKFCPKCDNYKAHTLDITVILLNTDANCFICFFSSFSRKLRIFFKTASSPLCVTLEFSSSLFVLEFQNLRHDFRILVLPLSRRIQIGLNPTLILVTVWKPSKRWTQSAKQTQTHDHVYTYKSFIPMSSFIKETLIAKCRILRNFQIALTIVLIRN